MASSARVNGPFELEIKNQFKRIEKISYVQYLDIKLGYKETCLFQVCTLNKGDK